MANTLPLENYLVVAERSHKTVRYHRQLFFTSISLKIPWKRMKTVFFQKALQIFPKTLFIHTFFDFSKLWRLRNFCKNTSQLGWKRQFYKKLYEFYSKFAILNDFGKTAHFLNKISYVWRNYFNGKNALYR